MANVVGLNTKRRYGLDWPEEVHDIQVDLICAKKWNTGIYPSGNLMDPAEHMLKAIKQLFTPDEWCISPWTLEHIEAWTKEDFSVWLGAASTSKSNDVGFLALLDWITDPTKTYIALASTSVEMLKVRSFESVVRAFNHLKSGSKPFLIPGKYVPSINAIVNVDDDMRDTKNVKPSIRGVALQTGGDQARAVAKLAGAHLPWVTTILDEGAVLPPAAAASRVNASAGTQRYRFCSLANPISFNDEATKFCEPVDGWGSVNERTSRWRSRYGLVLHHNGLDSPTIIEPDGIAKYPFLINQPQIDRIVREEGHNNADAPIIWTMVHGFPSPVGLENTVLANADIIAFEMAQDPGWAENLIAESVEVAGLDPAFTSGGDNCVLVRATVGYLKGGVYAIYFHPPDYIPIKASDKHPAVYQIAYGTRDILCKYGVPIANLAVDDSGTQSVCDVIEFELGVKPLRCNFANSPSDRNTTSGQPFKDLYKNRVTEMWSLVAGLGRRGQVRGLGVEAGKQFCARHFKRGIKPLQLESKKEYKKRLTGQASPDEADATALAAWAAQEMAGLVQGTGRDVGHRPGPSISSLLRAPMKKIRSFYSNELDIGRLKAYRKQ